jgi:glycosyltransferase involved in cell wall biosynthesis
MRRPQKTLVILSPAFPTAESGSTWVPSKQLFVKKLKENFPSVHIVVLSFLYPDHQNTYSWNGAEVTAFNGMHKRKLGKLLLWRRVWKKLASIHRSQTIIGIYSFWCGECALVGKYFARQKGLKHFCWISGLDATKDNKLIKFIRPQADELVAMSVFLQNEFEKNHGVRPRYLVPIGIDRAEFAPSSGVRDIDLLGAGSFNPFKQYTLFVQVVKKLAIQYPSIKAVICGGGTEQELLEKLIREQGLESNLALAGLLPHGEVLKYMQRAKIFIHPSSYEGFGAVCIEALYAGCEVVSFTDPMQIKIPKWHIVASAQKMDEKVAELMEKPVIDHSPLLLYDMNDSAKAIMKLFETGNP